MYWLGPRLPVMTNRVRPLPRDQAAGWPAAVCEDPVTERARLFVLNLRAAMGGRTLREVGALTGVDHTVLSRVLNGWAWPDGYTVARLETRLGVQLWPVHHG